MLSTAQEQSKFYFYIPSIYFSLYTVNLKIKILKLKDSVILIKGSLFSRAPDFSGPLSFLKLLPLRNKHWQEIPDTEGEIAIKKNNNLV